MKQMGLEATLKFMHDNNLVIQNEIKAIGIHNLRGKYA